MKLTFTQKLQIIDYYKTHRGSCTTDDIVLKLQERGFTTICAQTVRRLVREEESIRQYVAANPSQAGASRQSAPALPDVEARLYDWIKDAESRGLRLTGGLIRAKARRIADELQFNPSGTIKFSDGWLTRFKNRYNLKHYVFHGEAASAPVDKIDEQQRLLRAILDRYEPRDRFNVDETGLNYRSCPNNGIASEPMSGVKVDKTRLTYVLCTSAAGEKLTPLVIGHAKRPRCFTHGDPYVYGFYYKSNKNAWMTKEIWQEYISELNALMKHRDRHIVLLCDNASSHKHNPEDYSHVEVVYLAPNLTAWIQPMDAGIIRTFKAHYRRHYVEYALDRDAQGVENPYAINQLQGMRIANRAWRDVTPATVQNCWSHTRICSEDVSAEEMMAGLHL